MIKLTKRLEAIKNRISPGGRVIDVGTDHGMLPVYLAENNLADSIIATDINAEPLSRGRELAAEHGVEDRIDFILTDGLRGIEPAADTIVIAGMGGETMIGILEEAAWVRDKNVHLILQPQSKFRELTGWLSNNGFGITDGELIKERNKYYVIIEAEAAGSAMDEFFILRMLSDNRDPLLPEYLDLFISRQKNIVKGLENSAREKQLEAETEVLKTFSELKKETETWQQ